jgi:hypothetical protein
MWESPIGLKTVHFWAPVMKWSIVIAGIAVREGLQAWRGDVCCSPATALRPDVDDACHCGPGGTDACCADAAEHR